MWRFATPFASQGVLGEEVRPAFFETLFLCGALQAVLLSDAWQDSLAHYASLTTFGHIMVYSMTFIRNQVSSSERQIMLSFSAILCFLSAPFYASSHTEAAMQR